MDSVPNMAESDGEGCALPADAPEAAGLFSGAQIAGACRVNLDQPYSTFWYSYHDRETGSAVSQGAEAPGCSELACALHVVGPTAGAEAFSSYGAGVGFPFDVNAGAFDASRFAGIQYWARGTIVGTRGPGYLPQAQTVFLKLGTSVNRLGDDFGVYCQIDPEEWTLCRQEFSEFARDGYSSTPSPAEDVFDSSDLVRAEFEFPLYRGPDGNVPQAVSFDIELAAVSFF